MHDTGCSGLVHWDDPEGWDGMRREMGGGFRIGNTCTFMVDSSQCIGKTNTIYIRKLWYIYTMEYYSAIKKNTFESVLMRWMKLEPIILSEVSQKEKHQYSIIMHIYGI